MRTAVIVDAVRTASGRGKPGGALAGVHPVELLATVLTSLLERHDVDPGLVDDVIAGCVDQAGEQSLNIGRQGVLTAGLTAWSTGTRPSGPRRVPTDWPLSARPSPQKLNPRGGAIAMGHPLGASGTRLIASLLGQLEAVGGRYGLQTMCEGGGMANATIIERL